MKIQFYEDEAGEFRSRIVAKNGNILFVSSEGYKNRADCEHAAELLFIAIKSGEIEAEFLG
jgi:uncharacterized protein YegP (UPF0339 family)